MPIRERSNSMIVDPEAKLRQIFETVDVNRDGSINKREMIKFCRSSPDVAALLGFPEGVRQEDGSRDILEMRFQAIDRADDREVTWEEFRDFFMAEMAADRYSVQHPREHRERLDHDNAKQVPALSDACAKPVTAPSPIGRYPRTQEPIAGSPQTRKRHSALMEELLEKMADLSSKIGTSDEDPMYLMTPTSGAVEPVTEPSVFRPPSRGVAEPVAEPSVFRPPVAEPIGKVGRPARSDRYRSRSTSAFRPGKQHPKILDLGNLTVQARIAQQLLEKLRFKVSLFGDKISDLKVFHEVCDGQYDGSRYGQVPRHFSPNGWLDRFELDAAFRRLDIFVTPQDVDRLISMPLALDELRSILREDLESRRHRLYRPVDLVRPKVVPKRSLSHANVVRGINSFPPRPFSPWMPWTMDRMWW